MTPEGYVYIITKEKDRLTEYNGQAITYDRIGNPLTYRDGMTMTWKRGRQLTTLHTEENSIQYKYDSDSIRTSKIVDGVVHTYEYLDGLLMHETRGEQAYDYYYDANGQLYAVSYKLSENDTQKVYYFTHNWRGDIVGIYNGNGDLKATYSYDAWGNVTAIEDANGNAITSATHIANLNPFRYRGYYMDTETGLYYLLSRYYDPVTHRFLNADDVVAGVGSTQGYNLFAYCVNNPINMTDSNGDWPNWAKKLVVAVAVVAVVAVVAAVTVATAGAGTAAAVIAVGAAKGAAIGLVTGAAIGAGTAAVNHRVSTGSWKGADKAALNGAGDGALSGAIVGTFTGAASGATKVYQASKAWDSGTFKSGYQSMNYHYNKHVIDEGLTKGNNVLKYTRNATSFANRNSSVLKYTYNYKYGNASWNLTYAQQGGMFTSTGKIITFWYR